MQTNSEQKPSKQSESTSEYKYGVIATWYSGDVKLFVARYETGDNEFDARDEYLRMFNNQPFTFYLGETMVVKTNVTHITVEHMSIRKFRMRRTES